MTTTDPDEGWYWDLRTGRAVPAAERGPSEHLLGPYPSRAAAEEWRRTVEARNEAWDDEDERWRGEPADDAPDDPAR